jgi:hypothetical protein
MIRYLLFFSVVVANPCDDHEDTVNVIDETLRTMEVWHYTRGKWREHDTSGIATSDIRFEVDRCQWAFNRESAFIDKCDAENDDRDYCSYRYLDGLVDWMIECKQKLHSLRPRAVKLRDRACQEPCSWLIWIEYLSMLLNFMECGPVEIMAGPGGTIGYFDVKAHYMPFMIALRIGNDTKDEIRYYPKTPTRYVNGFAKDNRPEAPCHLPSETRLSNVHVDVAWVHEKTKNFIRIPCVRARKVRGAKNVLFEDKPVDKRHKNATYKLFRMTFENPCV